MNIQELLSEIKARRLILINENEIWPSPMYTPAIRRAMRRHRASLKLLIAVGSIETCPARDLHRKYWRYAGAGCYECEICEICEKIAV